ncbi:putative tail fiber protein [Salmonella phage GEC_vB_MG]|nr:putative tail fiber protein [Salmonella phage GEC_vB_MG]
MTQFEQAVDQVVEDSERLHKVVNGTASETVVTEDGSTIPTVRKALLDNLFFKTPPIPWTAGSQATVFNQLYAFTGANGVQWWYAPGATASAPVTLPANPSTSVNWRLYNDAAAMASIYAPINSPVLTGNPQAPTPAANSNSTTIATTAFVTTAVANALSSISGGSVTFANVTVSGATSLNNLTVTGTTTLNGPVNADNSTGRFQNLILTKQASSLTFVYTDAGNPTFLKTRLDPYAAQTHSLKTDIIVNGTVASDDTTMSLTGIGNNVFDYVYIRGNSEKDTASPRLKVTGITEVENLRITGTVTGLSLSVDGMDIAPNSVTTADGVTVGGDLQVNGNFNVDNISTETMTVNNTLTVNQGADLKGGFNTDTASATVGGDLTVSGSLRIDSLVTSGLVIDGSLEVTGTSIFTGGFNTGTSAATVGGAFTAGGLVTMTSGFSTPVNGTVGGTLQVSGVSDLTGGFTSGANSSVTGNLNVSGDVDMNGSSGTTTVNNLVIRGTVTGLTVDLTGQSINVASLTATGSVTAANLTVQDSADLPAANIGFLTLVAEEVESSTASWTPSGESNIYNVLVDADLTIGKWPSPPNAFSAVIYLTQDATGGHTVTLDPNYLVLNSETINQTAGSVTILQLTYNGVADDAGEQGVIDTVIVRRP